VGVSDLATLIDRRSRRLLEVRIFQTSDVDAVASAISTFVEARLGRIDSALFYRASAGLVVGLRCAEVGDVVLKIHRRNGRPDRLEAVQFIQRRLAENGFPAPRPLLPPTPIADALATAEELINGERVDGHDAEIRREVATRLAEFISVARRLPGRGLTGSGLMSPTNADGLWGNLHDDRCDFEATSVGAEWIDALASDAYSTLSTATLPEVVAHLDWRVQNLAIRGRRLVGVYDWDSLGRASEPVAAGQASAQFSTDWSVGRSTLPSVDEMADFLADYQQARDDRTNLRPMGGSPGPASHARPRTVTNASSTAHISSAASSPTRRPRR
jgi:hypothetical protein